MVPWDAVRYQCHPGLDCHHIISMRIHGIAHKLHPTFPFLHYLGSCLSSVGIICGLSSYATGCMTLLRLSGLPTKNRNTLYHLIDGSYLSV
jgi:hypothetical protein